MKKMNLALFASLIAIPALAGCGSNDDPNAIKIACVKLGYGTEWLTALTKRYTEKTGVTFSIQPMIGQAGNNGLDDELRALSGSYDLYGLRPNSFYFLLYSGAVNAKGKRYETAFEPLDDIYTAEYSGENGNNTMEKKMDESFKNYANVNGHYYAVPWANGFVTIMRNLDIWQKLGFSKEEYPRTTDELFEMMDEMNEKIASDKTTFSEVAPMIYCETDEYYSTILGSWFAQYEGDEEMQKFYAGRNPDGKRGADMFTYEGIAESLKVMKKILEKDSGGKYVYQNEKSKSLSFTSMQQYFLFGSAAMCVNGTWLEVENADTRNHEIDSIKIPMVSSIVDKLVGDYSDEELREMVSFVDAHYEEGDNEGMPDFSEEEDIEIVRESRNTGSIMRTDYDHLFVIPSWADQEKKPETKKFLQWMYSDEALQLFYDTMKGHHLPATPSTGSYNQNNVELSYFRKTANKFFTEGNYCRYLVNTVKDKIFSVAGVQSNFSNTIAKKKNCISWLADGMTVEKVIEENTNALTSKWQSILNSIGKED